MDQDTYTTVHCSISLDGFIAGPDQTPDAPGGTGGMALHRWHSDREQGGRTVDRAWAESLLRPRGAYLMGRNMYSPVRGSWASWEDERGAWRGWWGEEPPYHAPVVVLTHHDHDPVEMAGGTTFHFVTGGFDAGLALARELGDGDVHVAGVRRRSGRPWRPGSSTRSRSTSRPCCSARASRSSTARSDPSCGWSRWPARRTRPTCGTTSAPDLPGPARRRTVSTPTAPRSPANPADPLCPGGSL